MVQVSGTKLTMAEVVAARKQEMSPGRVFAQACAADGLNASVEFDVTITDSLTTSRRKHRYPARNMLKVTDLSREPRQFYWHETPPRPDDPEITLADVRREVAHRFHKSPVPELLPTTGWVQVPPGLWEDPDAFKSFINYRLIIRLSTAENHTIIRGDGGLLNMPQLGRITAPGPLGCPLLSACNEVEQMGGTADGLIINPLDYYNLMSRGGLIRDLEENGVFIVRARLVDPGTAIVGDFGHGAQLFDAGRSIIRFVEEPPPGMFAEPGITLMAQIYERVVVNLPTNFFIVSL